MKIFTCRFCGEDTSHKPSNRRTFCNLNCFTEFNRKYHPKQKRVERSCLNCRNRFSVVPSANKKFCSSSCSASYNNQNRSYSIETKKKLQEAYINGKLTGLVCGKKEKKPNIKKICLICGNAFWRPAYLAKKRKYCSVKCGSQRPGCGGYNPGSVRNFKSGWYESSIAGRVWLDSSYEFIMAKYLDEKGYRWRKNTKGFSYLKEDGSEHLYVPDFYIEDLDLWVETKGYVVANDKRKLDAFPHKIVLIGKSKIYNKSTWGF